jgi:cardiolipin synthase (CMP-forming)
MSVTIPNLLSLLRMGLVPLFVVAVIDHEPKRALLAFLLAGITDALDGFIARFWGQQSLLGSYLDPIADKLLLTSAYVVLSIPGLNRGAPIPVWVTVLVIARDVLTLAGALVLYLASGMKRFPPNLLSKITTAVQVVAVLLVLLSGIRPGVEPVALAVVYVGAVLTAATLLVYVARANRLVVPRARLGE